MQTRRNALYIYIYSQSDRAHTQTTHKHTGISYIVNSFSQPTLRSVTYRKSKPLKERSAFSARVAK